MTQLLCETSLRTNYFNTGEANSFAQLV